MTSPNRVCKGPAICDDSGLQTRRVYSALVLGAAFACMSIATALVSASAAPYQIVLHIARSITGSRNPFSPEQYSVLLPRILLGGIFYGVLGFLLWLSSRRLAGLLASMAQALGRTLAKDARALARAFGAESRWRLLSLTLCILVGIALRVRYLGEPPRYDESFTYLEFAKRSLVHVFAYYPAPNNHILHTALVWISCRMFGGSLWAMRLPALLAGIALIPLIFITAHQMAGRSAALLAAGLMSVSGPFVLYSVNARGYTLQAVFLLIMLYAAARIVDCVSNLLAYWVLFSVAAIASFWVAPSMLYSYLLAAGWLLWAGGLGKLPSLLISASITILAVIALYMPVMIVSGPDALFRNPWVQPLTPEHFRAEALRFPADLAKLLHGSDPVPFALLVALGALLSFVFIGRSSYHRAHPLLLLLVVLLILPPVQRVVPFPRVLLPLFPVYYLSAAMGWCSLAGASFRLRECPTLAAFLTLIGILAFHLTRSGYIESWREFPDSSAIASYLVSHLRPSDRLIVTVSAGLELVWELDHDHVSYAEYSSAEPVPARVLVATENRRTPGVRGNGLIDPSLLTVDGMLRYMGLNAAAYTPAHLIFSSGRGEVFELLPRRRPVLPLHKPDPT